MEKDQLTANRDGVDSMLLLPCAERMGVAGALPRRSVPHAFSYDVSAISTQSYHSLSIWQRWTSIYISAYLCIYGNAGYLYVSVYLCIYGNAGYLYVSAYLCIYGNAG